jgi:DNA-binding HxlR family transcriptional regulator
MGTHNSKACLGCKNDPSLLCHSPSVIKNTTSKLNSNVNDVNVNPNTNIKPTQISVDNMNASKPSLNLNNGKLVLSTPPQSQCNTTNHNNVSSHLNVLIEVDKTTDGNCVDSSEVDLVEVPTIVTDFIKPKNARKNIMDMFEVIRTLGDGMSSSVFEVNYLATGQRYALKRLRRAQKHSDLLFVGECKFLNVLDCKGVIRTIDAFADKNYFYVLNELGSTDLFKKIKANQRLSEKTTKEMIRYLLETVKELHRNNMVHRDIKPENVVFTDKDSNFPKLIDFGDALMVKNTTVYKEFVGTPCYLAPERWRQHYGWELKAADIWAIGVLTFEMVTGRRCFYASSDRQLAKKIQQGHLEYPKDVQLSNLCRHFIHSLLTVKSEDRPTAEFALQHPWLYNYENGQVLTGLVQKWNSNAINVPNWTVYRQKSTLG